MLRFLPPLVIDSEDVDRALDLLAGALRSGSAP
jgi:4-aminobutyrate aminotransferase-like enzyme